MRPTKTFKCMHCSLEMTLLEILLLAADDETSEFQMIAGEVLCGDCGGSERCAELMKDE